MSAGQKPALFLERSSYRQRRLRDAARLLPLLGAVLFAIPLLWPDGPDAPDTADALIYTFIVWIVLIVLAAIISSRLWPDDAPTQTGDAD